jgi:hypothetical protein
VLAAAAEFVAWERRRRLNGRSEEENIPTFDVKLFDQRRELRVGTRYGCRIIMVRYIVLLGLGGLLHRHFCASFLLLESKTANFKFSKTIMR